MNKKRKFTLNKFSIKYFLCNTKQNLVTLTAILLTTIMFTIIFTIELSVKKSVEQATCRQVGTTSDITFEKITRKQTESISKNSLIKEYGTCIYAGVAANKGLEGAPTEIRSADDEFAKMSLNYPTVGRMPKTENEIATDTIVLDYLNIPHKVGEKITLKFKKNPKSKKTSTAQFVLSGFWEGDIVASANKIWMSKAFVSNYLSTKEVSKNLIIDIGLKNHSNTKKIAKEILGEAGLGNKNIKTSYNWAYEKAMNFKTKVLYSLGILLILVSGYLIINNTIQISLAKEIQFYGRLKTIGMTSNQIYKLLRKQVAYLCMLGVPIGLLTGYGVGFLILPLVLNAQSGAYTISSSPVIFLLSALFAIITVLVSSEKAVRIVGAISPIEALKFQFNSSSGSKRIKKSRKDAKLHRMAFVNIKRNPRRFVMTIISLSLGFVVMNSIYTINNSFDIDKYLKDIISTDFYLSDSTLVDSYYNMNNHTISKDLLTKIKRLKGFKGLGNIYYHETRTKLSKAAKQRVTKFYQQKDVYKQVAIDNIWINAFKKMKKTGKMGAIVYGEDNLIIKKQDIYYGKFDLKKFETGKYVLVSGAEPFNKDDECNDRIGENVIIDGRVYKVMAYIDVLSLNRADSTKTKPALNNKYIIPSKIFLERYSQQSPMLTYIDFDKGNINDARKYLAQYKKNIQPNLAIKSRNDYVKAYRSETVAENVMGQTLSIVIILIGILNFINTLTISMVSRRKEFALMESVGMTKGQLAATLIYEGIYYAGFTVLVSAPLAAVCSLTFVRKYISNEWTNTYHFTLMLILIGAVGMLVFSIILPVLFLESSKSQTVVQRLRMAE
ncbi:FtsX-like permease family protein [Clostridium oryzae]|uniref:ABC transporter permease YtrF n=1 Tax=Clostridium oryzae TaxID=1450648 RepID=A0A1V4IN99_9CLOT|nr:FtsX-like permease family protein [Clostridium oryzae]OPJ61304.1 ABC transporter permease YtrF precursor [Clostridium oryzae]